MSKYLTSEFENTLKPVGLMFQKPVSPTKEEKRAGQVKRWNEMKKKSRATSIAKLGKHPKKGHKTAKKRAPRVKQIPLPKLVKRADDLFSLFIRNRDKKCVTPDSQCKGYLQASHLFKRSYKDIRWDEKNVYAQCKHHNYNHDQGFRPSPHILTNYFLKKHGQKAYEELFKRTKIEYSSAMVRAKAMEVIEKYANNRP